MAAKLLFDADDGTILGAQIVGRHGVDKRIDVIATAMAGGLTAAQLADLELAYAPPFSSAKDPVNLLGYMAENVLSGDCDVVQAHELPDLLRAGWQLIDVRTVEEHAAGAIAAVAEHPDRHPARPPRRARRPVHSSSTARSGSGATPRPRCCTSSASRLATSTVATARGSHGIAPERPSLRWTPLGKAKRWRSGAVCGSRRSG